MPEAKVATPSQADSARPSVPDLGYLSRISCDEALFLKTSGYFDQVYYLDTNPDIAGSNVDPFEHFFLYGFREARKPNLAFDSRWYLEAYPEVKAADVNPLLHFALAGEREGRRPNLLFETEWYRKRHGLDENDSALLHYLAARNDGASPIPQFDPVYYLATYPDVAVAGIDPFEHYMLAGFAEGRNPSKEFDTNFYVRRYLGGDVSRNPLLHFLAQPNREQIPTVPSETDQTIPNLVKRFSRAGDAYEELRPLPPRPRARRRFSPTISRNSIRSPKTTNGGARASPNGPTSPAACRASRTISSRACRATSASTISSIWM